MLRMGLGERLGSEGLSVGRPGQRGVRACDAADGARRAAWDGRGCPANRRSREDRPRPGAILLCDAPLLVFSPGSRTSICLEKRKGEGLVNSAQEASRPGGATPVLIRCRRILRTSGGSVMTASTFMGEPQRLQRRASTS